MTGNSSNDGTATNDNNDGGGGGGAGVSAMHDFIAGGVAGSASVIVGRKYLRQSEFLESWALMCYAMQLN